MINNIKNYKKEESVQLEIYSKMSYAQKWKEFHKLRKAAWVLKTADSLHLLWRTKTHS